MSKSAEQLRAIKTFEQLSIYLEDELDWPLDGHSFEESTFEYVPSELGLRDEDAVKVSKIHQLRPLEHGQPWGIFFLEFEKKKLPVVVLRRILSHLVIKKRASANKARAAAWDSSDLLFISAFGDEESDQREIAFAHFQQQSGDLPTLRVLGWDGADTPLKLEHVAATLHDKLRWPENTAQQHDWRLRWSSAFRHRPGHVIRTADHLAEALAALARRIHAAAVTIMQHESEKGHLRTLHKAFREALIHDLTEETFADTYAQTITYGLLTAAISRTVPGEGTALIADNIVDMVPTTNPFLAEMLQTFLKAGGRKGGIDFDELGIQDVIDLLRDQERTDLAAVLHDFGNRSKGEDPVIHFYEHFLAAYNKKLKIQRGVFYTPQPVVSYIVRSVHELLQAEFGLADGLASTATWGEMLAIHLEMKLPTIKVRSAVKAQDEDAPIDASSFFVQILDPATGTATFLVEVISVIHKHLQALWKQGGSAGLPKLPVPLSSVHYRSFMDYWNAYVPAALLPRLHGYELMMAPYAIAHMKIGLKLQETGFTAWDTLEREKVRARIYLTNALEPPQDFSGHLTFDAPELAHEAISVNSVKRRQRFTVVMGNPPYSKMSGNLGPAAVSLIEPFRYVDGERIVEKGALALELNLQDDYVKFWGFLSEIMRMSGIGVVSYITNSRYLASPSLRGLRAHLCKNFTSGTFLDLGGQVSERRSTGRSDENVFDIEQGVAIATLVKQPVCKGLQVVLHGRLTGTRHEKYHALENSRFCELVNTVPVSPPSYLLARGADNADEQFNSWPSLDRVMRFNSGSIITSRDNLAINDTRQSLLKTIARFAASPKGDKVIEQEIGYSAKAKWDVERCKREIRAIQKLDDYVRPILYRPFDNRYIFYLPSLLDTPSKPLCDSIYDHDNLVLLTPGVKTSSDFSHVLVCRYPSEKKACSHDRATQMFPLYLYYKDLASERQINIDIEFRDIASEIDTFFYLYAVLHCPSYRSIYGNALRDSYPRVPSVFSVRASLFPELARLGAELVTLHLLESPKLESHVTRFVCATQQEIEKVSFSNQTVWINKAQTSGFVGVPEAVWNFHIGGYQVCQKWLKDRKGRILSPDDIAHYHKIVVALSETIRLMAEIDEVIEQHGGWPGAFQGDAAKA